MTNGVLEFSSGGFRAELGRLGRFIRQEMKPKGRLFTPFNVITGAIVSRTSTVRIA